MLSVDSSQQPGRSCWRVWCSTSSNSTLRPIPPPALTSQVCALQIPRIVSPSANLALRLISQDCAQVPGFGIPVVQLHDTGMTRCQGGPRGTGFLSRQGPPLEERPKGRPRPDWDSNAVEKLPFKKLPVNVLGRFDDGQKCFSPDVHLFVKESLFFYSLKGPLPPTLFASLSPA